MFPLLKAASALDRTLPKDGAPPLMSPESTAVAKESSRGLSAQNTKRTRKRGIKEERP